MLERRYLQGFDSRYPRIEALGGLFIVPPDAQAEEVRTEVLARGIRALEVKASDFGFLNGLPVEYLFANTPLPDIGPVHGLPELRSLALDGWTADLDLSAFPKLRWLQVGEVEKDHLDGLLAQGHPGIDHLAVGKWSRPDLIGLGGFPRLSHVDIGNSRSFVSLDGARQLLRLRVLELFRCPGLGGLEGIENTGLEHVGVEACDKIPDLAPLGSLPNLRSVQMELRKPPPLEPLFGLEGLEFVWLIGGKRPSDELARLRDGPSMRIVASSRTMWLRDDIGWQQVTDIYAMTDEQRALYERLHAERNAIKAW